MKKALFLFLILALPIYAQEEDLSLVITENLLNKLLSAVGEVTGTGSANLPLYKGEYSWVAKNPRLCILPEGTSFSSDVTVKIGFFKYSPSVTGIVDIDYATSTNTIIIKIRSAEFELYLGLFGKKLHITNIDLARFYKEPICFPGPELITKGIELVLSDGKKKNISVTPENYSLRLEKGAIRVASVLSFKEKIETGTSSVGDQ
ncbi:MAG: hypothetical protein QME07_06885 [bacterium]|nr:hypothetical protein [bacterium]